MKTIHVFCVFPSLLQIGSLVHTISDSFVKIRPSKRIVGGMLANIEDFPSTTCLVLQDNGGVDFRGGAVIVGEYWVITAAHCMAYISSADIKDGIAFVRSNTASWTNHYMNHMIIEHINHEQYNSITTDYDIALLKVKQPFKGSHEKPAKLPSTNFKYIERSPATVVGWGTTDKEAVDPYVVSNLRFANINITNFSSCKRNYKNAGEVVTRRMICAAAHGRDACVFDSGGPLYQDGILIGLVSWGGTQCADDALPGVYTRISVFVHWIHHKISANTKRSGRRVRLKDGHLRYLH